MTNERIVAHFDGSYNPRTKVASYGVTIRRGGQTIWQASEGVSNNGKGVSCNVAEYAGLAAALRHLIDAGLRNQPILILGDSQLVIKQMFGHWKIKGGCYADLARETKGLLTRFPNIRGQWVPRHRNAVADALSRANARTLPGMVVWNDTWDDIEPPVEREPWELFA
jgi:ribonuclease HI